VNCASKADARHTFIAYFAQMHGNIRADAVDNRQRQNLEIPTPQIQRLNSRKSPEGLSMEETVAPCAIATA